MWQATPSRSLIVIGAKGARATCVCESRWSVEEAAQEFERLPDAAIQLHWLRALIGSQFSQLPAAQCTWVTAPESGVRTHTRFAYYVCFHLRHHTIRHELPASYSCCTSDRERLGDRLHWQAEAEAATETEMARPSEARVTWQRKC